MNDLRQRIAKLPPEKRRQFARLLREKARSAAVAATIPRRTGDGPVPLSFAQQRLWFLHRFDPDSPAYNIPTSVGLRGRLEPAALAAALYGVVRRHEALRTGFAERDGEPVQVVLPELSLNLPVVELGRLDTTTRQAELRRLAGAEALGPFDLAHGPLLRAVLLRLGSEEHALLLTVHHIVADGWSMGVLVAELAALYKSHLEGKPARLAELPIQYPDFALWQRRWLTGAVLDEIPGDHYSMLREPNIEVLADRLREVLA